MSDREQIMGRWDTIRKLIADGNTSSYPSDIFESIIDAKDERIAELEAALLRGFMLVIAGGEITQDQRQWCIEVKSLLNLTISE